MVTFPRKGELPGVAPAEVPALPVWKRGRVRHWAGYPASWWRMGLRSRFARWLPFVLTGIGYAYAAAPDFGFTALQGRFGFVGLIALWVASYYVTQLVTGSEMDAYRATYRSVGDIISSLSGDPDGTGAPRLVQEPLESIEALLRRAKEIALASLRPHAHCVVTAHLLVPEWKLRRGRSVLAGLRAVRHDDFRPERAHDLIALDAPGAGLAFSMGEPCAVADTDALPDRRMRGRPYKSIAAFPVIVGAPGAEGRVRAVLSLDASVPYVFTNHAVAGLASFINPIVQVIGLILVTQEQRWHP